MGPDVGAPENGRDSSGSDKGAIRKHKIGSFAEDDND